MTESTPQRAAGQRPRPGRSVRPLPSVQSVSPVRPVPTGPQTASAAAPGPLQRPSGAGPRRVVARRPLTRETAPERARVDGQPQANAEIMALWDAGCAEAQALAQRYRVLARQLPSPTTAATAAATAADGFGDSPARVAVGQGVENIPEADSAEADSPEVVSREAGGDESDSRELELAHLRIATALRLTRFAAQRLLSEARTAVEGFPRCLELLECGAMGASWFRRILRGASDLTPAGRRALDDMIAQWDLRITAERFARELSLLLSWVRADGGETPMPPPDALRRVEITPRTDEGTASLSVIGPMPEILSLGRRLDETARAVQVAQRAALASGAEIPFDDGTLTGARMPMSLARLRYEVMSRTVLSSEGVEVPRNRFRLSVTVPALTLLGVSEAPATLDGITPLPAEMARELAGHEDVWYRVLTDPTTGAFLPLAAQRCTPTPAMLEHLRLRGATCAVPGCTRRTSWASEADHIEEFDRSGLGAGGLTELENLHLLCWAHHQDKTDGRLDPQRLHGPRLRPRPRSREHSAPPSQAIVAPPTIAAPQSAIEPESATASPTAAAPPGATTHTASPRTVTPPTAAAPAATSPRAVPESGAVFDPGRTLWLLGDDLRVSVQDDRDLVTPHVVDRLLDAWNLRKRRRAQERDRQAEENQARDDAAQRRRQRDAEPPPF